MNYLNSIEVENLIVFDKARFEIKPGVSVIRGINHDSKTTPKSANAVGKSLLLASFANVCQHAPPMSEKKNSAASFMQPKSTIKLDMVLQDRPTRIKQYMQGKSVKYDITIEGKKQKVRTPTQMRTEVTKLFSLSEQICYSTVLISTLRPPILWQGTSAQRYDFFEDIAELHYYDTMASKISKKISEIKVQEKLIAPWLADLDDLRKIYTGPDQIKSIKRQIKILKIEREKLREKVRRSSKEYGKYEDLDLQVISQLPMGRSPKEFLEFHKKERAKLESLSKKGSQLSVALERAKNVYEQSLAYNSWKKQLKNMPPETTKEIKRQIRKIKDEIEYYTQAQRIISAKEEELKVYNEKNLKKLEGPRPDWSKMEALRKQIQFQEHQSKLFKQWNDTGICPICKSQNRKRSGLSHLNHKKEYLLMQQLYLKYTIEDDKELTRALKQVHYIKHWKRRLKQAKKALILCQKRDTLNKNAPAKPSGTISKEDVIAIKKEIKKVEKVFKKKKKYLHNFEHKFLPTYQAIFSKFGDVNFDNISANAKKIYKKHKKIQQKLNSIEDDYVNLRSQFESIKQACRSYNKLNKKYQKAKAIVQDLSDWQILHKMYGPVGMRIMHMQSIVQNYIDDMNALVPMLFSEPFKFDAKLEGRNFNLLVTRHGVPSDVRYLSGAQSRLFLAASAIALRRRLPPSKQFNFIEFDEIDATVSTGEMDNFTQRFIPHILEEIPSVVIITPKNVNEWLIPNATNYIFSRRKGKTTIKTKEQLQLAA